MAKLETINYDCHRCIGKLLTAKSNPREKEATLDSMKKGFLLNRALEGGRKKSLTLRVNHKVIVAMSRAENLGHEKSLLNKISNSCGSKIESDYHNEISSFDSECNANEN